VQGSQIAPVPEPVVPVEPDVPLPGGQTQLPLVRSQVVTGAQSESSLQPGALSQNGVPPLKSLQKLDWQSLAWVHGSQIAPLVLVPVVDVELDVVPVVPVVVDVAVVPVVVDVAVVLVDDVELVPVVDVAVVLVDDVELVPVVDDVAVVDVPVVPRVVEVVPVLELPLLPVLELTEPVLPPQPGGTGTHLSSLSRHQ